MNGHHVSTSLLHLKDEPTRLPPSQSPFITLLQKNRGEGFYVVPWLLVIELLFVPSIVSLLVVQSCFKNSTHLTETSFFFSIFKLIVVKESLTI